MKTKEQHNYREKGMQYLSLLRSVGWIGENEERKLHSVVANGNGSDIFRALSAIWINNTSLIEGRDRSSYLHRINNDANQSGVFVDMMKVWVASTSMSSFDEYKGADSYSEFEISYKRVKEEGTTTCEDYSRISFYLVGIMANYKIAENEKESRSAPHIPAWTTGDTESLREFVRTEIVGGKALRRLKRLITLDWPDQKDYLEGRYDPDTYPSRYKKRLTPVQLRV